MVGLTHYVLVLSVEVSLGATGGEEEDVVAFVGGDSAGEDEGMHLCIGVEDFFCRGTTPCSLYHRMVLVILLVILFKLTLER